MKIGSVWRGGDQLSIWIKNDQPEVASDIRLSLDFGNGDEVPEEVLDGISGFEDRGRFMTPANDELGEGETAEVLVRVARQRTFRAMVHWVDESGETRTAGSVVEAG